MNRVIRLLGILPLLFFSSPFTPRLGIPEPDQIPNWPALPFWTRPVAHAPGGIRTSALDAISAPLPFVALTPCRLVDTRGTPGVPINTGGSFTANEIRTWVFAGLCGISPGAAAVSLNITVTNTQSNPFGFVKVWPGGDTEPNVSTLNWSIGGVTESNAAIVPLGTSPAGSMTLESANAGCDVLVDVNGYYDGSGVFQLSQSRRAILDQFWTPQNALSLGLTSVGTSPTLVKSDGTDLWVTFGTGVSRVRASDGKVLETWVGQFSNSFYGVLVAMGFVFATGNENTLFRIDPAKPAGIATVVAGPLNCGARGLAFDGSRIWIAHVCGSVSIVTPGPSLPWSVTNVYAGFSNPYGILYDGANIWVTDFGAGRLLKLDGSGVVLQAVTVGSAPSIPVFDGTNIWVPNSGSASVSVVRAATGAVFATLTGNGLNNPIAAAFDGQRVLVTNFNGDNVSLFRATDLAPLGSVPTGTTTSPMGVCSDGVNFWVTLFNAAKLARI